MCTYSMSLSKQWYLSMSFADKGFSFSWTWGLEGVYIWLVVVELRVIHMQHSIKKACNLFLKSAVDNIGMNKGGIIFFDFF